MKPSSRDLFRQELPRLVAEVALLVVITNANPPELLFWLVLLLVNPGYRIALPGRRRGAIWLAVVSHHVLQARQANAMA